MFVVIDVRTVIAPCPVPPIHYVIVIIFERRIQHHVRRQLCARHRGGRNGNDEIDVTARLSRILGFLVYDFLHVCPDIISAAVLRGPVLPAALAGKSQNCSKGACRRFLTHFCSSLLLTRILPRASPRLPRKYRSGWIYSLPPIPISSFPRRLCIQP